MVGCELVRNSVSSLHNFLHNRPVQAVFNGKACSARRLRRNEKIAQGERIIGESTNLTVGLLHSEAVNAAVLFGTVGNYQSSPVGLMTIRNTQEDGLALYATCILATEN